MSRRQRLHVPGGTYYIVQQGSTHQPIFSQPEDYLLFERLLTAALNRTESRLHAYCWTPNAVHLVVQIDEISVGRFMQGLTGRFARNIHQRDGASGHFFQQRYKAVLVDPNEYLLKLIHYVHYLPVLGGLVDEPSEFAQSSHSAYLGVAEVPWLNTRSALRSLNGDGSRVYQDLMSSPPSPQDIKLFERGGPNDLRVIGDGEFLANLPRRSRTYRSKITLEQIIYTVTCALSVEREHVLSTSRKRDLAMARALIAWFATERHVATLSEVARQLRRDPSTLSVAISRYRVCRPELFKLTALHYMVPLGSNGFRLPDTEVSGMEDGRRAWSEEQGAMA
jgi:REP element-mobilizing transposase RayT